MPIQLALFDFDGTIADTHSSFIAILNRLSDEFGYAPATPADVERMRGLSSSQLVLQSKISRFKIPFLLRRAKEELGKEIADIQPIAGMETVLRSLTPQLRLGILTSNLTANVQAFLERNQLQDLFEFVHSDSTLFGKHKIIRRVLANLHLPPSAIAYIGDETRDIEAAKRCRTPAIAVTWGFNAASVLAQHQPDFLVTTPAELVAALQALR
ncbi:MAG: HAD-IA family hydrolase [Spirulinaceae cyanobacterium SM2_1_0]|nr:HAD-IA family hydrolase [Spirulinaceae cyanobacterium SM2_1_0]